MPWDDVYGMTEMDYCPMTGDTPAVATREHVTCSDLAELMTARDRVAVLVLLREGNQVQLVTYGRSAEDKAEAHQLKEWIKEEVFGGEVPTATTHESFILDAAIVKQQRDDLLAAIKSLADWVDSERQDWAEEAAGCIGSSNRYYLQQAARCEAKIAEIKAIIRKAEGGASC